MPGCPKGLMVMRYYRSIRDLDAVRRDNTAEFLIRNPHTFQVKSHHAGLLI